MMIPHVSSADLDNLYSTIVTCDAMRTVDDLIRSLRNGTIRFTSSLVPFVVTYPATLDRLLARLSKAERETLRLVREAAHGTQSARAQSYRRIGVEGADTVAPQRAWLDLAAAAPLPSAVGAIGVAYPLVETALLVALTPDVPACEPLTHEYERNNEAWREVVAAYTERRDLLRYGAEAGVGLWRQELHRCTRAPADDTRR
jgi:hypothetical protein